MYNKNKKAQTKMNIVNVATGLIILVVLIPIIVIFSAGTQQCLTDEHPYQYDAPLDFCYNTSTFINSTLTGNTSATNSLSTTERTLLGLIALFLILAFVYNLVKSTGLTKKR